MNDWYPESGVMNRDVMMGMASNSNLSSLNSSQKEAHMPMETSIESMVGCSYITLLYSRTSPI